MVFRKDGLARPAGARPGGSNRFGSRSRFGCGRLRAATVLGLAWWAGLVWFGLVSAVPAADQAAGEAADKAPAAASEAPDRPKEPARPAQPARPEALPEADTPEAIRREANRAEAIPPAANDAEPQRMGFLIEVPLPITGQSFERTEKVVKPQPILPGPSAHPRTPPRLAAGAAAHKSAMKDGAILDVPDWGDPPKS